MVSTHKVSGDSAAGFANYLTSGQSRGDYYAGGEEEAEAGFWHGSPAALGRLGLDGGRPVTRDELVAVMRGVSPRDGSVIRPVGGDGSRVAGIDVTFSAPKSVSALWALSGSYHRAQIEAAHRAAVASARERIEREERLVRRKEGGVLRSEPARSVVAAEFMHTSSRLTAEQESGRGVPDPQLHSHLVVLAAERADGRFAAIDSRELFRSGRVSGAWYRAELAARLQSLGLDVRGQTGKDGRYFELAGVPVALSERWSARSEAIAREAVRFRERYGREPRAGELGAITVRTRGSKSTLERTDVDAAWRAVGEEYGFSAEVARSLFAARAREASQRDVARELLHRLGREQSMVSRREVDARAYELAAGAMAPRAAAGVVEGLIASGELVELEGGVFTTRELRELEQRAVAIAAGRSQERVAAVSERALADVRREALRALGSRLSAEQRQALETLTGPGGVSVLVGQAGTGKGVVLGSAASAWRSEGYEVLGTAIAGATAQRLAADAKLEQSLTTDALLHRLDSGAVRLGDRSVVVMDEAGMADTQRLAGLVERTDRSGAKLVLVGDEAQLGAIGAGGLFGAIEKQVPSAELSEVRRAREQWERQAWAQVRVGAADRALAAYREHERLHVSGSREDAAARVVGDWDRARQDAGAGRSVMLTDASNREIDEINRQAQQVRADRGELGNEPFALPGRPYSLFAGDQVMFSSAVPQPGAPRVENGTLGTVSRVAPEEGLWVRTGEPEPREVALGEHEAQQLRLAYGQHVYKAQGLTVDRAHVLLGGWQTDRERAYVALTRARDRTDVYVSRDDLGEEGLDEGAIERLAERMAQSHAQQASVTREQRPVSERVSERETMRTQTRASTDDGREQVESRDPQLDRGASDPRAQAPRSEAGRLLAAQRERERLERNQGRPVDRSAPVRLDVEGRDQFESRQSDLGLRAGEPSSEAQVDHDRAVRTEPGSVGPDGAVLDAIERTDRADDERRVEDRSVEGPRSEAGRALVEQRDREELDRGWGIE